MPTGPGSRPTFSCSHPGSFRHISFARPWRAKTNTSLTNRTKFSNCYEVTPIILCRAGANQKLQTSLSPALVVFLAVILVPAGDLFHFRLLSLLLLEEVVAWRNGGFLV